MADAKAPISVAESQARRRQKLILVAVLGGISALAVALALLTTPTKPTGAGKGPETKPIQIGGANTDKEAFVAQFRADQERMRRELDELRQWKAGQEEREKKKRAAEPPAAATSVPVLPPPVVQPPGQRGFGAPGTPPPPPVAPVAAKPAAPVVSGPSLKVLAVGPAASGAQTSSVARGPKEGEREDPGTAERPDAGKSVENYIPSGSFARAVLLNGLDAPTGGNAQQNPHPVLLQLLDDATLPNQFRSRLQSCFITAAGHGDISSERAFIRLDRLSCVDEHGGAVDIKVQGYAAGEDGKTGLRGRLVTKSGQVLANALLTGLLSGVGKGIQADSVQQNTTITGAVTTQVTNPWRAGIGEGVGKAFEDVSRYYMRLADKIFPIVEIDAGRVIDVVITRGVSIERR